MTRAEDQFYVILTCPPEWSERVASILLDRLVDSELPPEMVAQLCYWSTEAQSYNVIRERATS